MPDILGYARVSTGDQDVAGQTMRLTEAGAIKIFTDVMSGNSMDRPGLTDLLAYARSGDTLAVVRLERRLISESTKDGIAAARGKGKKPGRQPLDMAKLDAALTLIEAKISPAEATKQLGRMVQAAE